MAKSKVESKSKNKQIAMRLVTDKLYKSIRTRTLKAATRIGKKYGFERHSIERNILFNLGHSLKIAGK